MDSSKKFLRSASLVLCDYTKAVTKQSILIKGEGETRKYYKFWLLIWL